MLLSTVLQALTLAQGVPPVSPVPAPQAGTPHLAHSAPFVGKTLTIHVDGAPPQARVDLFLSPSAGATATPYGILELARSGLHEVASGITSTAGSWSVDFPIPLDASLAETEQHFQAIVDDPSGPTGRMLSDALHVRLLGSRVYASVGASYGFPGSQALEILAGTTESVVAKVEFGTEGPAYPARPVFDVSYARGAVMSSARELLFFDPFFGGVMQRIEFASDCSAVLILDSAGTTVFVLDSGSTGNGRIHAIDFATGSETAIFDLPNPIATGWPYGGFFWCEGTPGTEAYIAEMDLAGQTSVRRVALEPLADLGSVVVGTSLEDIGFMNMIYAAGQVFASTNEWPNPPPHYYWNGCVTRCLFGGSANETWLDTFGYAYVSLLAAVPDADRLVMTVHPSNSPGGGMIQMPLAAAGPIEDVPLPPVGCCFYPRFMNADGKTIWAIVRDDEDSTSFLFRFDLESMTWSSYLSHWIFDAPGAAELLHDSWNHEYWVANTPTTTPRTLWPEIRVVDETRSTTRHIRLDRAAFGLYAVPLP
jgi:hypothetical protein